MKTLAWLLARQRLRVDLRSLRILRFVALLTLAALTPLGAARAQSFDDAGSNAEFWLHERSMQHRDQPAAPPALYQRPTHLIRKAKPVRGFTRSSRQPVTTAKREAPAAMRNPAVQAPAQAAPSAGGGSGSAPSPAGQAAPGQNAPAQAAPAQAAPSQAAPNEAGPAQAAPSQDATAPAGLPDAGSNPAQPAQPGQGAPAAAVGQSGPPPAPGASQDAQKGAQKPAHVFTVAVIGDSLGEMLEEGLADIYADKPDVAIVHRARESTGLVREDYFNWAQAAKELANSHDHIDMAIMMIGSNDRQPLQDSTGVYEPLSARWKQIYAARVTAIAAAFHEKKIPLLWIGAPIMKSASLSEAMIAVNELYKEDSESQGASYLDVWDLFSDDSGQYALYGPDVNGNNAKLRASDGVHFTRAGSRKLAQFVEPEINRIIERVEPRVDPRIANIAPQVAPAAPLSSSAVLREAPRAGQRVPNAELQALLPAPAAPLQPVIPIRPAAGPVVALTAPIVAPDGQLVSKSLVRSSAEGAADERELTAGQPLGSRPGRSDDFRWPLE